jgi:hypothetical protein
MGISTDTCCAVKYGNALEATAEATIKVTTMYTPTPHATQFMTLQKDLFHRRNENVVKPRPRDVTRRVKRTEFQNTVTTYRAVTLLIR